MHAKTTALTAAKPHTINIFRSNDKSLTLFKNHVRSDQGGYYAELALYMSPLSKESAACLRLLYE